jgi:hypothetical protein
MLDAEVKNAQLLALMAARGRNRSLLSDSGLCGRPCVSRRSHLPLALDFAWALLLLNIMSKITQYNSK